MLVHPSGWEGGTCHNRIVASATNFFKTIKKHIQIQQYLHVIPSSDIEFNGLSEYVKKRQKKGQSASKTRLKTNQLQCGQLTSNFKGKKSVMKFQKSKF